MCDAIASHAQELSWPSRRYERDPVGFARDILGLEPWSRQIEVLEAVRDHDRVAVTSGHKTGKGTTAAILALWYFTMHADARVVMSSTTARQVDQILWRELTIRHGASGACLACTRAAKAHTPPRNPARPCPHSIAVDGRPKVLARSGLRIGHREVVGFTAKEAEAVAGISGEHLFYILDEASGIPSVIYEAIEGNRAGGAKIVMFSNPTRTEGEFYEAFESKARFYRTISISSEETPNVVEGRVVVPGLARREWIEEKREEWGAESALYKIRVKGEFVKNEDGKIFSVHAIAEAEARWQDALAEGPLHVGIDPAGPGNAGDETAIALRRGLKILSVITFRGLTEEGIVVQLLGVLHEHVGPRDPRPVVKVDREGPIGSALYGLLRAHLEQPGNEDAFELVPVRSSDRALRQPQIYGRTRDELWASLADWFRQGGAIPEDTKLSKELHAPEWVPQIDGRLKVTPKEDLRKALNRSPDRADAVALAVWERQRTVGEASRAQAAPPKPAPAGVDPYHLDGFEAGDPVYGGGGDPVYG